MNAAGLGQLIVTFAVLSLLSLGGANATIPEIHRQVVDVRHWMDDATFAHLIAIGQTAPGPNVLIVSMIGWRLAGTLGLLAATLAIVVPSSLLAVGVGRLAARFAAYDAVGAIRMALAPIAIGFMLASGYVMTRAAYKGTVSIAIVAATTAMIAATRRSPVLAIGAGALIGLCGHRLHIFG